MAWTDDPVADFAAYDRRCQRNLERYPKCDCCKEYITDEHFYMIDDEKVCENCLNSLYREDTENWMED